jgi:hypothetical protein
VHKWSLFSPKRAWAEDEEGKKGLTTVGRIYGVSKYCGMLYMGAL